MQPEFTIPEFLRNNSAEEIHQRMMNNLPADIDSMPGGFPYDFTKPAALEKDEFINYHLARAMMIAFPQYAWDEWLDLHGLQVHLARHPPGNAAGSVRIEGKAGAEIVAGTVFCTPSTETGPSIGFRSLEDAWVGDDGTVLIPVTAVESGAGSNVPADTVTLMARPDKHVTKVTNPESITGGTERENNDDFYDRIAAEYANSLTFLGNDSDYVRWAKEAGAGDCIVLAAAEGPGTVGLALVDGNGRPAGAELVQDVYNYIVSPQDRSKRLLPTACAKLACVPASTVMVDFTVTGLVHDDSTTMGRIEADFAAVVKGVYAEAKQQGVLRYNDVRPVLSGIAGVTDFESFLMNGEMKNIRLGREEYPETGALNFRKEGSTDGEI